MNSIILSVVVKSAPESRFTGDGTENPDKVTQLFATFKHGYGERERIDIIKIVGWNDTGNELAKYPEGAAFIAIGRVDVEKVQTENGNRNIYQVVANEILPYSPEGAQINVINLAGNTGQDPDVKYFESGKVTASTSLAVRKGKNATNWFNLEGWSQTAETIANYVRSGSKIAVTGSLSVEHWNDSKTGDPRSRFGVKIERLTLMGSKGDAQPVAAGNAAYDDEF